jgi:predicted Mrr-cat superfamily restriction endonuclease
VFGNFMTVNQYISPFNPQELASLAAEASLSLNYFNNAFKSSYIYRGNDFQSFGQSFIRTDVAGFNISDVLRLMENKIFLFSSI